MTEMKGKNLALSVILTVALVCSSIITPTIASPPIPTVFNLESVQVSDDIKFTKVTNDKIIVKAISNHNILSGSIDGTLTLNIVLIVEIQTGEAFFSGSFVITETGGDTIHGSINAIITDFWSGPTDYVVQGTFNGGGYMRISGTISKASGSDPLVWEGISW